MKKTAVVILSWNGRKMLERFLPSVVSNTTGNAEVIVADNGSTDDSLEFMANNYPEVRLIKLDKNYGFAGGYNRALEQVEADYFVLLNDDVEVTPHWVEPVVEMLESNKQYAIAQPKLLMYDQRDTFEYAGAAGGFIDKFGYPFCRGRIFNTVEKDQGQYDDPCEIFWASGAAMFVKAEVWNQLGGLDEDFFAHMEEIDFCWRAKNCNYKVVYCPKSKVYHVGGGTLPKSNPQKTYLNFRNNLSMIYKNARQSRLKDAIFLRWILDWVAAFSFLLQGHFGEFHAVFRAHRYFTKNKKHLMHKRRKIWQQKVPCVYHGLLLVDYHLLRKRRFSQLIMH